MVRARWNAALLVAVQFGSLGAIADPSLAAHDLRVGAKVGVKVLLTQDSRMEGSITTLPVEGPPEEEALLVVVHREFVDEYLEIGNAGSRMARYVVDWREDHNGEVRDPEVVGLTFDLAEQGQTTISMRDGRLAQRGALNEMLQSANCTGLWLPLPKEAEIGDVFAIGLDSLVCMMLGLTAPPKSSRAELMFESIDEAGVAVMKGRLETMASVDAADLALSSHFGGDLVLRIDTKQRRVTRVEWRATQTAKANGEAGATVEVSGPFQCVISAAFDDEASSAADRELVYRDSQREVEALGVRFALPSHWMPIGMEGSSFVYKSTIDGDRDTGRNLEIAVFPAADPVAFTGKVEEGVKKQVPDTAFEDIDCRLGKGRAATFEEDGRTVLLDLIPADEHMIRVRLDCQKEQLASARLDMAALRRSIERSD